nr:DUF1073 domain-containing protein [Lichenibacterium minor]
MDLRPQLERLDWLICWSEDIDEGALTFAFRPLGSSPSCFSSVKRRVSGEASSAATSASAWLTTTTCERADAAPISRASGGIRSG